MINYFQTNVQIKLNLEEEHNLMIVQWNIANPIQPQNYKKINHLIKNCLKYKGFPLTWRNLNQSNNCILFQKELGKLKFICYGARTTTFECNGSMLAMWNRQVANIKSQQYNNVSFHDGVGDIVT